MPVLMLLVVLRPQVLNPDWQTGTPASELVWFILINLVLWLLVWAAFRSRIELADGRVSVVNPWGSRTFAVTEVERVQPGHFGMEFLLIRTES